jgi:hypothetical protein
MTSTRNAAVLSPWSIVYQAEPATATNCDGQQLRLCILLDEQQKQWIAVNGTCQPQLISIRKKSITIRPRSGVAYTDPAQEQSRSEAMLAAGEMQVQMAAAEDHNHRSSRVLCIVVA